MIKICKYFFEALLIYFCFFLAKILGLKISQKVFSLIFQKFGPAFKSDKIINKNLNKFSNNMSYEEIKILKNKMWSNYGKTLIEYIFLNTYRKNRNYVEIDNEKILTDILNKKESVIFVSGHFANFEIMSMEIVRKGINLATIYRPLNNFFLNPFMEFLRKKYVCKNQIKKGRSGVRQIMSFIDQKFSIALMIDQRVSEGEIVNLFGHPAFTTTLPAQLALKYKLNIVPVFIKRTEENKFKLKFQTPINISLFKNKSELTENLNKELEKLIKENPEQWIWTHNRWKI